MKIITISLLVVSASAAVSQSFAKLEQFERRFERAQKTKNRAWLTDTTPARYVLGDALGIAIPKGGGYKLGAGTQDFPHGKDGYGAYTLLATATSVRNTKGDQSFFDFHGDYQFNHSSDWVQIGGNLDAAGIQGAGSLLTPALTFQRSFYGIVPFITTAYQFGPSTGFYCNGGVQWVPCPWFSIYAGGQLASHVTGISSWNTGMLISVTKDIDIVGEYDQGRVVFAGLAFKLAVQ